MVVNPIISFLDEVGVPLELLQKVRKCRDLVFVFVCVQATLAVKLLLMVLAHGIQANVPDFFYGGVAFAWRRGLGPQRHPNVCGCLLLRFFHIKYSDS